MLESECYMYQRVRSTKSLINVEKGEIYTISGFGPVVNGIKSIFLEGKRTYYNPRHFEPLADHLQLVLAPPLEQVEISSVDDNLKDIVFNTFRVPEEYLYPNKHKEEDNMKMPDKFDFYNKLRKFRKKFSLNDEIRFGDVEGTFVGHLHDADDYEDPVGGMIIEHDHETELKLIYLGNPVQHVKRKDELEPGDKFISNSKYKFKVLARKFDKRTEYVKYFAERCKDGYIGVLSEEAVLEVIYDD